MNLRLAATLLISLSLHAQDDFPLTEESKPQPNVPKGQMLKDTYTAKDSSVFPGTEREYQIYLPANLDTTKPAPFMVFQDGVIYNAPTVFDNLIAKKDLPPMIGIFIKPGVVPAANENALPRYNRSYEYDSVTDTYSRFLIDEFLPAIVAKHKLNLSADPNARGISGNSSGGICAFMVAWHRPDQFRRVFTGVGTYVGIHGADQLPVLVRKHEPKPLRVFLQSGENDNNLYCGDWWMANQMMERSLTWNGYDVNHAWGKGGHNAKHASQIFPEVLRWLWKGYPEEPVKANPRGDAKWRGYEVIGAGEWEIIEMNFGALAGLASSATGDVYVVPRESGRDTMSDSTRRMLKLPPKAVLLSSWEPMEKRSWADAANQITRLNSDGSADRYKNCGSIVGGSCAVDTAGHLVFAMSTDETFGAVFCRALDNGPKNWFKMGNSSFGLAINHLGKTVIYQSNKMTVLAGDGAIPAFSMLQEGMGDGGLAFSPDQTWLYACNPSSSRVVALQIDTNGKAKGVQEFFELQSDSLGKSYANALTVDTNGWLYVATSLGVQVLDQAGRVNFIIPTPERVFDLCFGGPELNELFIAGYQKVYKRPTKAKGYISGQMAPIKPPALKL